MRTPYAEYVRSQSGRNPCLYNLCQFLDRDKKESDCQITSLEFFPGGEIPDATELQIQEVSQLLDTSLPSKITTGRILIIEDLTSEIIELLGASLNIDPLFFASHIYGPTVEITASKPSSAILPSKSKSLDFLSLQYQRTIEFDEVVTSKKVFRDSNVPRKVAILPPTKKTSIGLVQYGCSVLSTRTRSNAWISIILVDPPTKNKYTSAEQQIALGSKPFQGGYEDFLGRPTFPQQADSYPQRLSLRKDLIYYWQKKRPPDFNLDNPSLLSLAYYPMKIAAAEWVIYIEAMSNIIKQYEYSTEVNTGSTATGQERLTTIDADLRALQVWGRRSLQTLYKLRSGLRFLKYRIKDGQDDDYLTLVDDYKHLVSMVDIYRHRLETLVPLLTSVVQITDTRRSLREAANVTRLTNLALFFVPLSFVSSLFSINEGAPARVYGIYCAVAIPVFGIVLFLAHPPSSFRWLGYGAKVVDTKKNQQRSIF